MTDKSVTTDKAKFWGASFAVKDDETVKRLQELMNVTTRHMADQVAQSIYGDNPLHNMLKKNYVKQSWFKRNVVRRLIEAKNRISNAYDCLVKGVDPYDGY